MADSARPNSPSMGSTVSEVPAGATVTRVEAPNYYASQFQLIAGANDVTIVLGRNHPILVALPDAPQAFGLATETQAVIHMSPQSAKELAILLQQHVEKIEQEFGKLETPFTRERGPK